MSELSSLSLILPALSGEFLSFQALLDGYCNSNVQHVSMSTIIDLVFMGFGQAIAFQSTIPERRGLVARPIEGEGAAVTIEGIWPKDEYNPLRDRLLDSLRGATNELGQ
jgi:hypothetical protein